MFLVLCVGFWLCLSFFFFKQKTAYEMRISDWSSDVCSSDLIDEMRQNGSARAARQPRVQPYIHARDHVGDMLHALLQKRHDLIFALLAVQIGRASCRERVCQYV